MKLLFPKELIDENLEGFKEKVTRTLKLFPKAVVPRDIHGEIVYPAVNHPPDTHCKEKRLGGSRCLLSPSSPERQALQIEGEKGVKTQSAPNIGRGRAKDFGRANFQSGRPYGRAGKERLLGRTLARQNRSRGTHGKERPRSAEFRIGTDRPCRSIRETNDRPRPKFSPFANLADQIARPRQIHRPSAQNFSRPRYPMAKTKGNESMKKKKNPFMEPPKKQIKLGSSSSNARAAIPITTFH
ncbi:unnamed protein product [Microthlaspi erraticum]|uniref:Uncharacterized protein n=1 Tax=Microthlaspi erraticum TaxID=1685480 RepID=A0A6D2KG21_9BRAS|nr:unnamed protein product [Microthlaspi erraticum]